MRKPSPDRLKILFLAKSTPVYGGVERWLADLVLGLTNMGHDCVVGLAKGAVFHDPKAYKQAYPHLKVTELDGTTGSPTGRQLAVSKALYHEQPDIVVPVMLADGLKVSAFLKTKLPYTLIYPVHEICQGVRNDLSTYASHIDFVVFVDESGKQGYQDLLSNENRSMVLPCGVQEVTYKRVQSKTIRVGYCGRIAPEKRPLDLIPLCTELNEIDQPYTLKIVGEGRELETLKQGLSNRISGDTKMPGNIEFHRPVDRDQLYQEFYNCIDVLIVTSEGETGPLVAFEAMMNGAVVITSNFNGLTENQSLKSDENCLIFPVGDMKTAASYIKRIDSDARLKTRLIEAGYNYAHNNRRLTTMCESWHTLFMSVVSSQASEHLHQHQIAELQIDSALQRIKEHIRKIFGIKFLHQYAGEEWPFFSSVTDKPS